MRETTNTGTDLIDELTATLKMVRPWVDTHPDGKEKKSALLQVDWAIRQGEASKKPLPPKRSHRRFCKVCECDMWEADNHVGKGWCDACSDAANS